MGPQVKESVTRKKKKKNPRSFSYGKKKAAQKWRIEHEVFDTELQLQGRFLNKYSATFLDLNACIICTKTRLYGSLWHDSFVQLLQKVCGKWNKKMFSLVQTF